MSVTASLIETPPVVNLQGIPCLFTATSSLTGVTDIYMHLLIQQLVDDVWTDTDMEDAMPLNDGATTFDISGYFSDLLKTEFAFPEHSSNLVITRPNMVNHFRVKVWESYIDSNGDAQDSSTEAYEPGTDFYMLPGGIHNHDYSVLNDLSTNWWEEHVASKRALNWMPDDKQCSPNSIEKIYWVQPTTGTDTLRISWTNTDGETDTTDTTISLSAYIPVEISASPAIAEELTGETLASFTVGLVTAGFSQKFTVDRTEYEFNGYYLFENDLAGFDGVWCHGARKEKFTYTRNNYQKANTRNLAATDFVLGNIRGFVNRESESNSGYTTRSTREWLAGLLNSGKAYRIEGLNIRSIILTDESMDWLDEFDDDVVALSFNWKYSQLGKYISRMAINLQYLYPPYYDQLEAFFYKLEGNRLLDKIGELEATISGTDITFPEITGNDIFDFSNATYWDQTLIAATSWYDSENVRTCPLSWMVGTEWAEAAEDITHARLFHRDYDTRVRDMRPVLVYASSLATAQQQEVADWLDWYATIWQSGSLLTQSDTPITQ